MLSTCKNVFVVKPCYVGRAKRFPGGGITLDAIRLAQRHGFIVQTVVKRSTKRQNMFNLDLVTKQHRQTDLDKSEEHTSELQSLMRISYAVFCLKKKKITTHYDNKKTKKN